MRSQWREAWDVHAIRAEIKRRGYTFVELSRKYGLAVSAIRTALVMPYPKADRVISAFLGVPLHNLWPDRYDRDGNRLPSQSKPNKSAHAEASKKGRAA